MIDKKRKIYQRIKKLSATFLQTGDIPVPQHYKGSVVADAYWEPACLRYMFRAGKKDSFPSLKAISNSLNSGRYYNGRCKVLILIETYIEKAIEDDLLKAVACWFKIPKSGYTLYEGFKEIGMKVKVDDTTNRGHWSLFDECNEPHAKKILGYLTEIMKTLDKIKNKTKEIYLELYQEKAKAIAEYYETNKSLSGFEEEKEETKNIPKEGAKK
jgi:hypothetical protein